MSENDENKGFKHWFVNVFRYYYGRLAIVVVVLAIAAVFMIVDASKRVEYDFNMAIAVDGNIPYSQLDELEELVSNAVGDLNGDGTININIQLINLGADGEDSQLRLMLLMALDEYPVFIMDERYSAIYAGRGDFNDLSDYGFTPDPDFAGRIYIGDTAIMNRVNPVIDFYACLADWTTDNKGRAEWTQAAVRVIQAILDS